VERDVVNGGDRTPSGDASTHWWGFLFGAGSSDSERAGLGIPVAIFIQCRPAASPYSRESFVGEGIC
jgi:hypothetical protein